IISRTILSPKDFSSVLGIPQLDLLNNLQFNKNKETGLREESVNCMRLFKGDAVAACHAQGRKLCKARNERRSGKKDFKPDHYYGYRSANVGCIRELERHKGMHFDVHHTPRNDNWAHCDVVMVGSESEGLKTHDRKMAKQLLVKCFDTEVRYQT
ncbi:MAG: hypothetical protein KDI11_05610, partial [Alphaproteobacteria bacterium]|nr:hypothetical protein [Alphaproteobacteria bacterium]